LQDVPAKSPGFHVGFAARHSTTRAKPFMTSPEVVLVLLIRPRPDQAAQERVG
jgi:hypothetical protein